MPNRPTPNTMPNHQTSPRAVSKKTIEQAYSERKYVVTPHLTVQPFKNADLRAFKAKLDENI